MSTPLQQQQQFGTTPYTPHEHSALQAELHQKLGPEYVAHRAGGAGKVAYVEGWQALNIANELFGFNGWSTSIMEMTIDFIDTENGRTSCGISCIMRITLKDGSYHEDVGYGTADKQSSKGAALEKAKKEAATDAIKRCLRNYGNAAGNCLYDKLYLKKLDKVKSAPESFNPGDLRRDANNKKAMPTNGSATIEQRQPAPNRALYQAQTNGQNNHTPNQAPQAAQKPHNNPQTPQQSNQHIQQLQTAQNSRPPQASDHTNQTYVQQGQHAIQPPSNPQQLPQKNPHSVPQQQSQLQTHLPSHQQSHQQHSAPPRQTPPQYQPNHPPMTNHHPPQSNSSINTNAPHAKMQSGSYEIQAYNMQSNPNNQIRDQNTAGPNNSNIGRHPTVQQTSIHSTSHEQNNHSAGLQSGTNNYGQVAPNQAPSLSHTVGRTVQTNDSVPQNVYQNSRPLQPLNPNAPAYDQRTTSSSLTKKPPAQYTYATPSASNIPLQTGAQSYPNQGASPQSHQNSISSHSTLSISGLKRKIDDTVAPR